MDLSGRIAHLAAPAVESAGLVLEDVAVSPARPGTRIEVIVDLPADALGSAGIDAVAQASRAVSDALDGAGIPDGPYTLEVTTPGVDRPLTDERHFRRARTRLVRLDLRDGRTARGRLADVAGGELVLDAGGETTRVPLADVERGAVEVEMKRSGGVARSREGS